MNNIGLNPVQPSPMHVHPRALSRGKAKPPFKRPVEPRLSLVAFRWVDTREWSRSYALLHIWAYGDR